MNRVTRAEAARVLEINKSTVTRWVNQHPALLGDDGLVDIDELREHRDQVINPAFQTRGAAAKSEVAQKAKPEAAPTGLNEHRARGEAAKAINAELDLAERLNLTLVRDQVEAEIAAAGAILKRKAVELARDKAEPLSRIEDPRAMERALEEMMRVLLESGARELIDKMRTEIHDDAA